MTYSETLEYLYSCLPMFSRIGKAAYKADLGNTIALCKILGNPEKSLRCIHVAGTNGKGSTSHMLASVLMEAGYKTGLYTSPHLKDFRERIRVNGMMMPEQKVVEFVERYRAQMEPLQLSFFEWTVGLCFDHFRSEQTDVAVVETGLGGRLDSTNVVSPLLSVITNIGWDHMDLLGSTLQQIALEKAGIIKQGVPAIVGEYLAETKPVFVQRADEVGAPLEFTQDEFELRHFSVADDGICADVVRKGSVLFRNIETGLGGIYQQRNLLTVIHALESIRKSGFRISDEHIRSGLKKVRENTGLQGRWQVLQRQPLTVCDTAHNVDGIQYVVKQIAMQRFKRLHMVIGTVNDKDVSNVLGLLPTDAGYYFCQASIPRAMEAVKLAEIAATYGLTGNAYPSVEAALASARRNADADDMIFIGGSTFVVAEII